VTSIAALSVQSVIRPTAVHAAAPVAPTPAREGEAAAHSAARNPAPALLLLANDAMTALIAAQAQLEGGHADPQPGHGKDDEHGHSPQPTPGPTPGPPPPVVLPPVTPPPVTPPVVQPPAPSADPAVAARAIAGIERALADGRVAAAQRSAFAAAAAERRAAVTVAQGRAALAILSVTQADMADFRAHALNRLY